MLNTMLTIDILSVSAYVGRDSLLTVAIRLIISRLVPLVLAHLS